MDDLTPEIRLAHLKMNAHRTILLTASILMYVLGVWGLEDMAELAVDYLSLANDGMSHSGSEFFPFYVFGVIAALKMVALVPGVTGLVLLWKDTFVTRSAVVCYALWVVVCLALASRAIQVIESVDANRDAWADVAFWVYCAVAVLLLVLCILCVVLLVRGSDEPRRVKGIEVVEGIEVDE